jgi:hypothetical protein
MRATESVIRHLPAAQGVAGIAVHVVDVLLQRVTAPQKGAHLSIAGDDPVSIPKRCSRANDRRFFSEGAHMKRDPALALNLLEAVVDDAGSNHRLVESNDLIDRQPRVEVWVEASVVSNDLHVPPSGKHG